MGNPHDDLTRMCSQNLMTSRTSSMLDGMTNISLQCTIQDLPLIYPLMDEKLLQYRYPIETTAKWNQPKANRSPLSTPPSNVRYPAETDQ